MVHPISGHWRTEASRCLGAVWLLQWTVLHPPLHNSLYQHPRFLDTPSSPWKPHHLSTPINFELQRSSGLHLSCATGMTKVMPKLPIIKHPEMECDGLFPIIHLQQCDALCVAVSPPAQHSCLAYASPLPSNPTATSAAISGLRVVFREPSACYGGVVWGVCGGGGRLQGCMRLTTRHQMKFISHCL